jgi:hypothetical protein
MPGIVKNTARRRPLAPKSIYAGQTTPATSTVNWATITHMNPPRSLFSSARPTPLSLSQDVGIASNLLRALNTSLFSSTGLILFAALVMLLALFYIAAYRRGIRDVKDDCQAERKMETNRREVDTRRHGIISGLIRNLNINIDTVRQDNQQSVEALATDIKSRIDIEHQANKYSVQALASDIESTKTVLQAKMGRVQAEITKLEQTKDKLVRDIRSAQSIRDRYKNEVDELQAKF